MDTLEHLRNLIAFPTVSIDPNRALIDYCAAHLKTAGADITIIEDDTGKKANLYATIGPMDRPGVLLSGHTDVVPVEGQNWTVPPFELTQSDGKVFGRGTTDMKGFIASVLRVAALAGQTDLETPLHIALSYDEEIGCVGVRSMIDMLSQAPFRPKFCIVGEPTLLSVATGHKGKTGCRMTCTGREGHSALAPTALNAIYMATDMINVIRDIQKDIAQASVQDKDYDVPYTTLHVGKIDGGVALNIVPNTCAFMFEIRNLVEDDPEQILTQIRAGADALLAPLRDKFPEADIEIDVTNRYPSLATRQDAEVVESSSNH
jgi:acetylornithine deacetylase